MNKLLLSADIVLRKSTNLTEKSYNGTQMEIREVTKHKYCQERQKSSRHGGGRKDLPKFYLKKFLFKRILRYHKLWTGWSGLKNPELFKMLHTLLDYSWAKPLNRGSVKHLSVAHNTSIFLMVTVVVSPFVMRTIKQRGL